jgi:hypothetical protein
MRVNNLLITILLAIFFSLLWTQSLANAEIKITPPANWQPSPNNNSTAMVWFQNSTKSVFGIVKPQFNTTSTSTLFPLLRVFLPLLLPNVNSFIAQMLADQGVLESTDQTTFGKSNYGYRYFVNLNLSSLSNVLNSSNTLVNNSDIPGMPDTLVNNSAIPRMLSSGSNVPFKGMLILALKQGDFYGIFFLSPRENFDTKMNELKPTLDSIQLSNSTAPWNSTTMLKG